MQQSQGLRTQLSASVEPSGSGPARIDSRRVASELESAVALVRVTPRSTPADAGPADSATWRDGRPYVEPIVQAARFVAWLQQRRKVGSRTARELGQLYAAFANAKGIEPLAWRSISIAVRKALGNQRKLYACPPGEIKRCRLFRIPPAAP